MAGYQDAVAKLQTIFPAYQDVSMVSWIGLKIRKFQFFPKINYFQMRNTSQSSSSSFEIKQEPEYFMYQDNQPETDHSSGYDSSWVQN